MNFEIINPSDPYLMGAVDLEVAAVAVSLLGDGRYPLKGLGDSEGQDVPPFLLGGHDEWFTNNFGRTFEESAKLVIDGRPADLISALESVTLASSRRSSLNNIGGRARDLAKALRDKQKEAA